MKKIFCDLCDKEIGEEHTTHIDVSLHGENCAIEGANVQKHSWGQSCWRKRHICIECFNEKMSMFKIKAVKT